jgi:xylitol oxidase
MRDDANTPADTLQQAGTGLQEDPFQQAGSDRSNWAGTYIYRAEELVRPTSFDELAEIVARSARVRGLGTRHSFTDVADGPGVLVDMTGIRATPVVAADRRSVTLAAGSRYGDVAPALDEQGVALHNMGSLPHISIGGATATGTHGSGTGLGSLSSAVSALEFVDAEGGFRTVRRGEPDFAASVLHLGLLGVVSRVTVDVEPTYRMRQDAYGPLPWSTFTANVAEVFAAGTTVCCFTNWDGEVREILVKSRVPDGADDVAVPSDVLGAPKLPLVPGDGLRTARDGSVGPWWDRIPHFTIDSVPSVGSEIQSEHFVPLRLAAEALDAVHALGAQLAPHLHVAELRTMAGDDLLLGPTGGEAVLCIAFTWRKHVDEVAALLPFVERALAPFGGRPHWGKSTSLDAEGLDGLFPGLPDFRDLVHRTDPGRKFTSGFTERLLGI